ncbi:MAG: hypothetical protein WAZ35_08505, partial [Bacteroidales bacterium]|nr:hypothetical protein [Bacteroidales bacterium]
MKITVNDTLLDLHNGARVRDAIAGFYKHEGRKVPERLPVAEDRYGNIVAPDGALTDGNALFILSGRKKRTRLIRLLVVILAAGLLFACSSTRHAATSPDMKKQGSTTVAAPAGTVAPDDRQAVIFSVNDMHAAIDNFPKLAWIVDSLRSVYPNLLLIAAGDNQTGNPVNDQFPEKGFPVIDLMNAVGFNLSAVGNHEFDTGP